MDKEQIKLENAIIKMISFTDSTPHFNYTKMEDGNYELQVYTFNSIQNQTHFLHKVVTETVKQCLIKIVVYLENHKMIKKERIPITITWKNIIDGIEYKSYYYESSEQEAIEKFSDNKDMDLYTYVITQNPIA